MQKSQFYSICEDANVPAGMVPWHMPCVTANDQCEPGSQCQDSGNGAFCRPDEHLLHTSSRKSDNSKAGAAVGISFGVLALLLIAIAIGFGELSLPEGAVLRRAVRCERAPDPESGCMATILLQSSAQQTELQLHHVQVAVRFRLCACMQLLGAGKA
jgi:hypothetical protein